MSPRPSTFFHSVAIVSTQSVRSLTGSCKNPKRIARIEGGTTLAFRLPSGMHHFTPAVDVRPLIRPLKGALTATRRGPARGFTIAELLAVLVMIGILVVAASPAFINMVRDGRIRGGAMQVVDMYRTARTRALGRGAPVLITWDNKGVLTLLEPIMDNSSEPSPGCTGIAWDDPVRIYPHMVFDFRSGHYENASFAFIDLTGATAPKADICYSSRGRAFIRTGGVFSELTGVPTFTVTNGWTGLVRTIFLPPNGIARLKQ
jgi:prepilin-type N-terminal cleavage/methylation domain-containing protein